MPYSGNDLEKLKQEKLDYILKTPITASLTSAKNKRVYPIVLSEMFTSAARTKDGFVTFAKGFYPVLDQKIIFINYKIKYIYAVILVLDN